MAKSTQKTALRKPRPDFPLFPHASGRWAKKVRGKFAYFGNVSDNPQGERALAKWPDKRDELLAGRVPRKNRDGLTVAGLCNAFLTDRNRRMDWGEITVRTFSEYYKLGARVVATFGKSRFVDDLSVEDFAALRESLAKTRGPVALGNEIQRVRTLFKFGIDNSLMETPIRFGTAFEKPPAKAIRKARAAAGPLMFTAVELRAMLKTAEQALRVMILLGVNCALGAADFSGLPGSMIDLKGGLDRLCASQDGRPAPVRSLAGGGRSTTGGDGLAADTNRSCGRWPVLHFPTREAVGAALQECGRFKMGSAARSDIARLP